MTSDTIYAPSAHEEMWTLGDDLRQAAEIACECLYLDYMMPWANKAHQRDWEIAENMSVTIAQGESKAITWHDIAPDLYEHLPDQIYGRIGENFDLKLPESLQDRFERWLEDTCGPVNHYEVKNIKEVDVVWRDGDWHLVAEPEEIPSR